MNRAVRWILVSALAVVVAGAVFTSIIVLIWPEHPPLWTERASAAPVIVGTLLMAVGASLWIVRRGKAS